MTRKALPLEKANVHNGNKNANTDFLAANIEPSDYPVLFRVMVRLSAEGTFSARIKVGASITTCNFNGGAVLVASGLYIFDLLVHENDSVNFRSNQNQTDHLLRVQEIAWGTQ